MSDAPAPTARTEALINLAEKLASQPLPPPEEPRRWPVVAAGIAVVVIVVGGIAMIASRGGDGEDASEPAGETLPESSGTDAIRTDSASAPSTASAPDSSPIVVATSADPADPVVVSSVPSSAAPATAPTDPSTSTTVAAPAATAAPAPSPTTTVVASSPGAEQPVRWAEFSGGKVYLRGRVPDQATADEVRDKAAAVVGEANVVVEYEIVAGTPRPASAPLYVRDSVLFARGSSAITDASRGVLDLGVALMSQNPQVTIDIQGHTDSDGTDEDNLELSQERVDAIFEYMVSKGVPPDRLTRQAFGESQPIADNSTVEGKALNRRVEFTINNLLG